MIVCIARVFISHCKAVRGASTFVSWKTYKDILQNPENLKQYIIVYFTTCLKTYTEGIWRLPLLMRMRMLGSHANLLAKILLVAQNSDNIRISVSENTEGKKTGNQQFQKTISNWYPPIYLNTCSLHGTNKQLLIWLYT